MAAASPERREQFHDTLGAALHLASQSRVTSTTNARAKIFALWRQFCDDHRVQHSLSDVPNDTRLAYLLVFGMGYRRHGQTGRPVRASTVEDALLAVGEGLTHLGTPDPRKATPGGERNHPLLTDFYRALADQDDPSTRSYPANLTILRATRQVLDVKHPQAGPANVAVLDLLTIGFFWLLRPAEYLYGSGETRSQAFRLQDITFTLDGSILPYSSSLLNDETLRRLTHATLTFSDQKAGVRGETITHCATTDPFFCPCKALGRIVLRLRKSRAPADTPIHSYYSAGKRCHVAPTWLTNALRHGATQVQSTTGIDPALLSARSLRPGGATALLCAGADPNTIQLLGRWRSDAMLRYLRVAASAHTHNYAQQMLTHGTYTFAPGTYTADTPDLLPHQLPTSVAHALSINTRLRST